MAFSSADKGKGRAADAGTAAPPSDSDTAPLLPPSSPKPSTSSSATPRRSRLRHGRGPLIRDSDDEGSVGSEIGQHPTARSSSRRTTAPSASQMICTLLAIVFVVLLVAMACLHLWIGHVISEQGQHGDLEEMAQRGVLFAGPSAVRFVQGGSEDTAMVVEMDGMAGVDVRKALDWESKEKGGWLRRAEGRIARWGVRRMSTVSVGVGRAMLFDGHQDIEQADQLVVVEGLDTIRLPLSYPSFADPLPQMDSFTLRIPVSFPSPESLAKVAHKAWDDRAYRARVEVDDVLVSLGGAETTGLFGSLLRRIGGVNVGRIARQISGAGEFSHLLSFAFKAEPPIISARASWRFRPFLPRQPHVVQDLRDAHPFPPQHDRHRPLGRGQA